MLGEGAYGTAHLVKHKNDPDLLAVIKYIDLSKLDAEDLKACFREAKILQVLDH